MLGYWKDEEKTKEAINSSNWCLSGYVGISKDLAPVHLHLIN